MNKFKILVLAIVLLSFCPGKGEQKNKWISLFDGQSLDGWKVGNNATTFSIENGTIMVNGETAHLFYDGEVQQHNFKNFELKIDVMTTPGSNSGVYFHTQYQGDGWPKKGYEVQV